MPEKIVTFQVIKIKSKVKGKLNDCPLMISFSLGKRKKKH